MVTMGQVGQVILLQDSLYFLTTPSSTRHSQFVHTSIISLSPACTDTHTDPDEWLDYSKCSDMKEECCFSAWLTPITVWLRTQASIGAAGRKAQIILLPFIKPQALLGQIRITSLEMTLIWESHLVDRHCNCNLVLGICQLKGSLLTPNSSCCTKWYGNVCVFSAYVFLYVCNRVCLPQWQRGQQSSMLQRNSVPSGQDGVSMAEQLTFVAEMYTSSFTFTHWCNTHFSSGDCHTSPTCKQTQRWDEKSTKREEKRLHQQYTCLFFHTYSQQIYCLSRVIEKDIEILYILLLWEKKNIRTCVCREHYWQLQD